MKNNGLITGALTSRGAHRFCSHWRVAPLQMQIAAKGGREMSEIPSGGKGRSRPDIAGLLIAAGLLALAVVCYYDAWELSGGPGYSKVGPGVAAEIVGAGLAVLGILNGLAALRGGFVQAEPYDLPAVLVMVGGFAAVIAIIAVGGGFIPGMTVIFASTAYAFGRRAIITDVIVGFVLSTVVYLVFTKLLTLSLPTGPLERLF
jgi:putative tricarboxylic transport membrane protein